jgi:hypothetical protein
MWIGLVRRCFYCPSKPRAYFAKFRWKRFFLTKTRRHVCASMREGRVLMQDVVATYHEVAASRNWF